MTTTLEIANHLARLRNNAGIKQNELAERLRFSPAVVSRAESGERAVSSEELNAFLEAIGTEEALQFRETIDRDWLNLPRPPLGHPEEPILWEAEQAFQSVKTLSEDPQIPYPFAQRLDESLAEICATAELVMADEYSIAFVGNIGAGKTTALCRITGLEVSENTSGKLTTVLDVGAGGITLCEVQIARGPGYGLLVEPRTEAELYREIREFARSFVPSPDSQDGEDEEDPGFSGTTREIERAIRNMSGLTIKRTRLPDGTRERTDPVRELAQDAISPDDLAVAIRARMNLQKRNRRELWYPELARQEPLSWLAQVFRQVNNGRHPEFSLPNRVEVIVPQRILRGESDDTLSIRLIDTKGIDSTSERGDLEAHFNYPNSLVVMCSTFNDAPSSSVQQLLDRAVKGGFPNVENKAAILVLPRPAEALAVRDDEGFAVDTVTEGYEIKGDQAANSLRNHNLPVVRIEFFNSLEDEPQRAINFLMELVNRLRNMNVIMLRQVIDGANALVLNHANEQVRVVQEQAAAQLRTWLEENRKITPFTRRPEDSLLEAIRTIRYASSLRASIRRGGEWYNLDYPHQLGYGTRAMAFGAVNLKLVGFKALADTLLKTPGLEEASDLVSQSLRIIESGIESLFRDCQLLGRTIYAEHLEGDYELWNDCDRKWGQGPGYRDRVYKRHVKWFEDNRHKIDSQANSVIETKWQEVLGRVSAILQAGDRHPPVTTTKEDIAMNQQAVPTPAAL